MRTVDVVGCRTCRTSWPVGGDAACRDTGHDHVTARMHVHDDAVTLPDGTVVHAVSFDAGDPYRREVPPAFGVYLDERWQPPWPHLPVLWPDFGLPADPAALLGALRDALDRARRGETVEIGCWGGHGRTGTALAALAVLAGCEPAEATAWVRVHYCDRAVETPEQEAFVRSLGRD